MVFVLIPKLIALDMDGTLLDNEGKLPPDYWELNDLANSQGSILVPASGRQHATLQAMFPQGKDFIAENGAAIIHGGKIISTTELPPSAVAEVLSAAAQVSTPHTIVLCTPETAFVQKGIEESALAEINKYYRAITWVDDLNDGPESGVIKIAIFCAEGSEKHFADPIFAAVPDHNVAVSGTVWLDVMAQGINKGIALEKMAGLIGIPLQETAAFGDFLNDYELLHTAGLAIAMENGHPKLKEIADIVAPANTEYGVSTVLRQILDSSQE